MNRSLLFSKYIGKKSVGENGIKLYFKGTLINPALKVKQ
jgi:hypothetical protein